MIHNKLIYKTNLLLFSPLSSYKVKLSDRSAFCRGVRLTSTFGKKGGENMAVESAIQLMLSFGILIVAILTLAYNFTNKKK
ncbi:putative holin-like toxin [Bacillus subtilis]|uniref:competence inhibitor ComI n=1 Tax=Bacillus subtilis TaxID=1423 RepID=UPI00330701B4